MRHRTYSPAYARLNESLGNSPDLSEILDISEGGMSIQTSSPLEDPNNLSLCLDLSETRARIRTTGQVVWSDTSGRTGIRFGKLAGQSLEQLKEWLFVNVLTAFDHALPATTGAEERKSTSNQPLPSHTMPEGELLSGPPAFSGYGSIPEVVEMVRERAVEPNGFDRETTLQLIAERALTRTRASGAAIALSDGNDSEMTCVASAGSDAPPIGTRLQVGSGFSGECVRTGRSLRCDDSETDDRVDRAGCKALGIRSLVAVPIRPGNRVAGLLEVFSPQPYAFNADDISALQQLTGNIVSTMVTGTEARTSSPQVQPQIQSKAQPKVQPRAQAEVQPEVQTASLPRTRPVSSESRPSAEVVAANRAVRTATASASPGLHKALLVAAIGTFIFAVVWLIAPWVQSTIHSSGRITAHAQPPQTPAPKSASLPAGVTDLAGLRQVAEHGDPAAQFALGARYATGEGVQQDYTEAVRWFTLAAEQGHIQAQATLGAYYWAGRGVAQDLTKAYYWSVLAQAGGDQASKYRVAVLTSRMSRGQVVAAQQQANDWLTNFASHPPSSP